MAERDILWIGCERGHDMRHVGGCNAGCDPMCSCSVPVLKCSRCDVCDYGDNPEARDRKAKCAEDWCKCGKPATYYEDPCCGFSGQCEPDPEAKGITNCIHCGKELHEIAGEWWAHDAPDHPQPHS